MAEMYGGRKQMSVYLSEKEMERLDAYCAAEQRSRNWAAQQAIEQMLDDYEGNKSDWNPNDVNGHEVAATGPKVNEPICKCEHWETQHHLVSGKRAQCKKCGCIQFRPQEDE